MRWMRRAAWVRRVVLALVALALLPAPVAPMRHAAAGIAQAVPEDPPCHARPEEAAAPAAVQHGHGPPGEREEAPPLIACCAAGFCVGLQGAPVPAPALPLALPRGIPHPVATLPASPGRAIPPALPPPRPA